MTSDENRCAYPKCKALAKYRRCVYSWFRPKEDQVPAIYHVCAKHDAEFFPRGFDRTASERVAKELMALAGVPLGRGAA